MPEVVTRLVIAADGSLRALGQFERGMEEAGQATEYTTGAVADYQRRMEAARAAMERGNAISTQTVQRKTAEQRAWERWSATVDKTTALRIRLEREAANASVAATNAVITGHASQEQAISTLMALERRHAAQLADAISGERRLAGALNARAAAADQAALATSRLAAANDNRGAGGYAANLAYQGQDVLVQAQMGTAPLTIALQQGTQAAMVLQDLRREGMSTGAALASAFGAILNPLTLVTIGAIALGAAGIQALMGIMNSADDATSSLERHREWLDQILAGYDDARDAATDAMDRINKLPQGVVVIEMEASLAEQEAAIAAFQNRIEVLHNNIAEMRAQWTMMAERDRAIGAPDIELEGWIAALDVMSQLQINSGMTAAEIDKVLVELKELYAETDNSRLKEMANDAYLVALELRNMALQTEATRDGLAELKGMSPIEIRIAMKQEFDSAMGAINDLYMDPRSRFDIAREELEFQTQRAVEMATSYGQAVAAAENYDRVLQSINAAEAEANARSSSRGGGSNPFDQWQAANDNFQQRIAQQELELSLLGQSNFEIERQRAAFELLNQAKQAGIPITDQVTSQINVMATEYATLTDQMRQQQLMASTAISINNTLANGFSNLWTGIITGSQSATEAIGGLLLQLGQLAINNAFMSLFGGGTAGGIGGALAGIFMPNALGNVYTSPGLSAYSSQIVDQPTLFPFAKGIGLMGEAGPEAIMPLRRGPDGRLGVSAHNSNGRDGTVVQIIDQRRNAPPIERQEEIGPDGVRQVKLIVRDEISNWSEQSLPLRMREVQANPRKRGGTR